MNRSGLAPSCHREGARVFEDAETHSPGAHCLYGKLPAVFIARRRREVERLLIQFHLLGHRWLHYPNARFFINLDNKVEFEANIVAARALFPFPLPRSHEVWQLEEESSFSKKLIDF